MKNNASHEAPLPIEAKRQVFDQVLETLRSKFYNADLLNDEWDEVVSRDRSKIESAPTQDAFEQAVSDLLKELKTSHLGFFGPKGIRASSRAALSATYLSDETPYGSRWIFQDVHEGGAAHTAGIRPGNILLRVNGKEIVPPEHPVFPMGMTSSLDVVDNDGTTRNFAAEVSSPKGKKLQFIEPTLVQVRELAPDVGYLKVAMFPGMLGVDVANAMSSGIAELGSVQRLVIDLRGNTGGGAGALRLMSLMTSRRVPVGFSPNKRWAARDLKAEKNHFPRLNHIPASKNGLWLLGLRFLPSLLRKTPVVLETEGLGAKPYHGRIVLLVDRHTASAAEMVTIFAKENKLATVVGEKTAGRLLSATSVKVGHGFRLALPTGAYYTWNLTTLEGTPLEPDVFEAFDWKNRRTGEDHQLGKALEVLSAL